MHILPISLFQGVFSLLLFILSLLAAISAAQSPSSTANSLLPSDAVALLSFKSKADLDHKLLYTLNERFDYCQWVGVKCVQGRVVRFAVSGLGLRGEVAPNTLSRLDQLRVLTLQNNSLAGAIPDLAGLANLKTLFLDQNSFSGTFPRSVLSLHRLRTLDLSHNNLTGSIPTELTLLDRLNYLRLDWNRFNGSIPPLNQSALAVFNVSVNNLTGPIPVTPTLSRFDTSSFSWNPSLCGEIIDKACGSSTSPFFNSSSAAAAASPPTPLIQNAQGVVISPPSPKKHKRIGVIILLVIAILILIAAVLCCFVLIKKRRHQMSSSKSTMSSPENANTDATNNNTLIIVENEPEVKEKTTQIQIQSVQQHREKSGTLVFCSGEAEMYTLEQLMRASAELLGRGTMGTTYKAVMDSRLIVSVKRVDAGKTAITTGEMFERHMELVGGLRHPNLVPVRAYFQAKQERLIIYDYQPNGSLFNLIHGSRSTRAKPLHWTSCLKIAEDVAQGLAYIHQASKLVHGNLKSSNVLLGADFEACLTDYCISVLADSSLIDDPDSAGYKAPEIRKSGRRTTAKSDVYAFGILLLELLTGKPPSQHPFLVPSDMPNWVRAMREDDIGEDEQLVMLVEVAGICSLTSHEQRPTMWQVLKMIQEMKESVMVEDYAKNAQIGYS
ncbi:probable inactive receptor kinase At5g67200 [Cornus florida]|uniref:probable inactive receptor kinase At5g67200 n=1 Tax=Cornus florida TaxID=4283 RepID=UPI00289C1D86|nr:probable inactive receptor kinase At5g67200 [Cornus florida]